MRDFASLLHLSIMREVAHRATCHACKRSGPVESRRSIAARDLPPILAVNACVNNDENLKMWIDGRKSRFLSPSVVVKGHAEGGGDEAVTYEIRVSRRNFRLSVLDGDVCCAGSSGANCVRATEAPSCDHKEYSFWLLARRALT